MADKLLTDDLDFAVTGSVYDSDGFAKFSNGEEYFAAFYQ
jgi:hypothetical protein